MSFRTFANPSALPDDLAGSAIAIGNFDGVHRGHQAVIEAAEALAKGGPAIALTFEPHPRALFRPTEPLFLLSPHEAKLRLLERAGLAAVVTLRFDRSFADTSAEAFLEDLVVKRLRAHAIAVGYDFHFGKDRRGTPEFLVQHGRALGLDIAIVAPLADGGTPISSSLIRRALAAGDVAQANRLLGHDWTVVARVEEGDRRGRALGYPTANLRLDPGCRLRHGIYAVRVALDGARRPAVANFGVRPTFEVGGAPLLEVHLFDFSGDLYGRKLEVAFAAFIRGEERFDDAAALVVRMDQDGRIARSLLA